MSNRVLVIGAVNIDIFASTNQEYTLEDSNLAKINLGFGGVGGNIATNLNTLGLDVSFITAFSSDILGNTVLNHYKNIGINIEHSHISITNNSSIYLGVLDKENDLFLGLNDMDIINELDTNFLKEKHDFINTFEYIVIDNNLNFKTLQYLLRTYQSKTIIMDAVSAKKVVKLKELLQYISVLKVNQIELNVLSNKEDIYNQIKGLLLEGVKEVLVTNKQEDVYYGNKQEILIFSVNKVDNIVNATGAGDAFVSGYTKALLQEKPLKERIMDANHFASLTLNSKTSTIEKSDLIDRKIY